VVLKRLSDMINCSQVPTQAAKWQRARYAPLNSARLHAHVYVRSYS